MEDEGNSGISKQVLISLQLAFMVHCRTFNYKKDIELLEKYKDMLQNTTQRHKHYQRKDEASHYLLEHDTKA